MTSHVHPDPAGNGQSPYDLSADEALALWDNMTEAEKGAANAAHAAALIESWKEAGRQVFREGHSIRHCFGTYERAGWEEEYCKAEAGDYYANLRQRDADDLYTRLYKASPYGEE